MKDSFPIVTLECYWYVVHYRPDGLGQRVHHVGKNKRCTCRAGADCPAVKDVANYLRNGGQRAPEPRHDLWLKLPQTCPICGGPTESDRPLDYQGHGVGWRCTADAAHYWIARLNPKCRARVVASNPTSM